MRTLCAGQPNKHWVRWGQDGLSKQEGKSKIFKPASCERVKDEAAGGGHRAARVLTTCVLRMQRAEKRVWAGAELLSCHPATWPLNKQDTERQSAVTIRSRRVHQDPRADEGFQSCSAGLPPLVVSSSAAICGLQGSEQFWVTEVLKQRWTTPRKWETIDFCLVSCADGHTWLLQVLTEEQADQNLPRLELSPLCQNKEKCYGWTGNALVYWKDN